MPEKNRQHAAKYTAQEVNRIVQQTRKNLLDNVTYELLTPLTTIRLLAESLQDDMVTDVQSQHTYYGKIISESKHMEQLIADLIELSKLQGNSMPFEKRIVRTTDIFGPVLARHLMRYTDTNIKLNIEALDLDNIPLLQTDAEKIIRLINILLDHSLKFAGQDGTVSIKSEVGPKHVTFCIQDNGPGIPESDLKNIFTCFYEANTGCTSFGNSLELAIAGQIAKGLDEKLWIESATGVGTSFYFTVDC